MKKFKTFLSEAKYTQKQPWALIDTDQNNKIIATSSDESGVKSSITTAHLPPLRVKDKSKLKIVKMKNPQQVGELLKANNLVESNQKYKVFVNGELKSTHSSEEDAKQAIKNLKWNVKKSTKEPFAKGRSDKVSDFEFSIVKEDELDERCWKGYKPTPGKKPYEKGSCMKEDDVLEEDKDESENKPLNKPFRTPDGPKKFAVYVKNDKGNVVKVTFGDPNMEIKRDSDDRRANFRARHNCDDPGPKDKARYWSCKMWSNKPVSKMTEENSYDFDELSGPKTKQKVGGAVGVKGTSPEDAIKRRAISHGYKSVDVVKKDDVLVVRGDWGDGKKDTLYYRVISESEYIDTVQKIKESVTMDASSAVRLFQKFLRSTGAPDKVSSFVSKNQSNSIFLGQSSNSKFDYAVDLSKGVVIATEKDTARNKSFIWNEKTGKLKINESAPPDSEIEKWIKDNKQEFSKQYGSEKGKQVLYATAWRMYNNK